ncbi:MAG: hypothetical protein C4586_06105 [Anaerolineaceae bacterium]|nr:MAG: hypothetical protein C4586_06105 [Anaerolineaceae bacterium]
MKQYLGRFSFLAFISYLMFEAARGFQKIAWGTGVWWGEYSIKWAAAYVGFIVFCILFVALMWGILFRRDYFQPVFNRTIAMREKLGKVDWLAAMLVLVFPVWFLQYTPLGLVFNDIHIRLLIWFFVVAGFAFFINRGSALFGWSELLVAVLLTSSEFVIAIPFMGVTDYPFSLGWSEGNRLWDYSILFGRHLYNYPSGQNISVLLDIGRQFVGGLPFIIPGLTIQMERFWIALTVIIPYLLLGLAAFRSTRVNPKTWLFATLWVLIFLKQGPIHPPLVLCAVAVAFLWRSPIWLALPLIAVTGFIAVESRFTWVFAPGLWLGMLELAGATLQNNKLSRKSWLRAISLGLAGMAGGQFGGKIVGLLAGNLAVNAATSLNSAVAMVESPDQPLLWYRLLPNETYGLGILAGLLIATFPLIMVLYYLIATKKWTLNIWQALSVITPLLAFLVVGLIVSTKIGGGGDLHNMDMFLIGLMFASVVAWQKGGGEWLRNVELSAVWIKVALVLLLALPGLRSLGDMRSFNSIENASWLRTLTDVQNENSLELYASDEATDYSLAVIRQEVAFAQSQNGEVLFMDQRQLLTFGYIKDVFLVPEYEKKVLMNQALSENPDYFESFYADLAEHRFSLIVSEPLRTPIKDSSYQFGEENNAWVNWVANPVLCYYEEKIILKEVGVQLLVPRSEQTDCSSQLPLGISK